MKSRVTGAGRAKELSVMENADLEDEPGTESRPPTAET